MWSSPLLLSLSSVFSLLGLTLVALAVGSDNWVEYQVNRGEIFRAFERDTELSVRLKDAVNHNPIYYSRNYGMFQVCFPDTVPNDIGSWSKLGSICINNKDYFPTEGEQELFTSSQTYRLYLIRATALLYIIGLSCILVSLMTGVCGCWHRSDKYITWSGVILMISVLLLCLGMAFWHYVSYMERYVLDVAPFFKSWEPVLKNVTSFNHGWSYVVVWVGIIFLIFAIFFMFMSRRAIRKEEEMALCAKQGAYMLPNYFDKSAMVPYGYNTYGGYGAAAYPYHLQNQYQQAQGGYYGYMTYNGH